MLISKHESEMFGLKYLTAIFWTVIYGQIINYLASALSHRQGDPKLALIVSIVFGLILCLLPHILESNSNSETKKG